MLGPVFWLELLRVARRGAHHRLRWFLSLALTGETAVFLLLYWSLMNPFFGPPTPRGADGFLVQGLEWLLLQQLAVVVLVAPALAAGSISDEKATGTLQHLLTTPLESRHIIVGKWLAQGAQVALLTLPGAQLLALAGAIVGLLPAEVLALALLPLVPLPALVAASLLASVWSRRTASAITRLYVVLAAGGLLAWFLGLGDWLGPGGVIAGCLANDGTAWRALAGLTLVWLVPVLPCLLLASWRLRPAYRKQLPGERQVGRAVVRSHPPVGRHPLRWKERYFGERAALLGLLAGGTGRLVVAAATLLVFGSWAWIAWRAGGDPWQGEHALAVGLAVLVLAGLMVAVHCAGSVSAERERQTWEPLLLTPLEPRTLLRGKLWGTLDVAWPYLAAYLAAALGPVLLTGFWATFWLVLTWLATWVVMYFTGATGLECSVRAGSSWRALVRALLGGTWVAGQRFVGFGLPAGFFCGMLAATLPTFGMGMLLGSFAHGFVLGSLVVTVVVLLAQAEASLEEAERRIDREERVVQGRALVRVHEKGAWRRGMGQERAARGA